jgi:DHA1 family tetracycline resistance protein-like MFS transporter
MPEPQINRHALAFIFITMLVDTIGLGIIIPVTPKLITELTGQGMSEAARWGGWLFFVYALMQFFCAPAIGNLSDRFGRRPVLIASLAMLGVDYLITAMAPTILWLFIARILSGIAGAAYPTANAYIADVSPPEKRAANFGLVGAAFGIGFVIGPAIQYGARLPFYVAAGIAFCNALYGALVLKESLPADSRRKFEWWRANPLGALLALRRFPAMLGLFGVVVLMRLGHDANPVIWTYYTMLKFNWSAAQVGYSLMVVGAMLTLVFSFVTRIVVPRIGEIRSVYLGLACGTIGFMGYAFATRGGRDGAGGIAGSARKPRQPHFSGRSADSFKPLRLLHEQRGTDLFSRRRVLCGKPVSRVFRAGICMGTKDPATRLNCSTARSYAAPGLSWPPSPDRLRIASSG